MKYYIIIAALVVDIILSNYVYGLQITEIMFNPEGADTGREWIEITLNETDGCINFTEYKLFEEETNHNIYKYNYGSDIACKYIIISNDISKFLQDYTYFNNSNLSENTTIYKSTFSLSNDGEEISIKKDNNIIDEINYTLLIENIDVTEGYSLEYYSGFWRNSELLKGNPGNVFSNINLSNINSSYDNLTNNISINNTTINFTENITENNITNNNVTNISDVKKCNATINIILKNSSMIYENNVPIKFQNKIEVDESVQVEQGYIIEYWIEDLFGNIVKNKVITNNQDDKSFTPKIEETDKILVIKAALKNYSINNYYCNGSYDLDEKIFLVKNSLYTPAKSAVCPACNSKTSIAESSQYTNNCPIVTQNESQKPLIKIINVCNESKTKISNDNLSIQNSLVQNNYGLNQIPTQNSISNNISNKTVTQNAGKTTSMIVYESPNMKNRLYALIGLILVGITCIILIVYKIIYKKDKISGTATEYNTKSKR
jgi:hypothetical protein